MVCGFHITCISKWSQLLILVWWNHYWLIQPMLEKSHTVVLCTSGYEINAVVKITYLTSTNAWLYELWIVWTQTCSTHAGHIYCEWSVNNLIMFCFFQFLTKDPKRRLGTSGNISAIKSHQFFKTINWTALLEKELKPLLGPRSMDVSSSDSLFISCHKHFSVQSLVSACSSSLTASTCF